MEEKSMWKKLKNNNKKGFTLVELIVVLVILAILAALLIPALTGYIDKAKEKQIIAETRQIVMASQTLLDEAYAKIKKSDTVVEFGAEADEDEADKKIVISITKDGQKNTDRDKNLTTVEGLSEVGVTDTTVSVTVGKGEATGNTTSKGKIHEVIYTSGGKVCRYQATTGSYEVKDGDSITW